MKQKAVLIGGALAAIFLFAIFFTAPARSSTSIPQVTIEEETTMTDPETGAPLPPATAVVKGEMTHEMKVNYKDGTYKTYSAKIAFPDLALGNVADSHNEEIVSIDFAGKARIVMPAGSDRIRQSADVLNTVIVYLGNSEVMRKTATKTYQLADFANEVEFYRFNISLENVAVAPGKYSLNFKTIDQVKFRLADNTEKTMRIEASPALGLENDGALKEIYVINTKPTVTQSLEQTPVYVHKGGYPGYEVLAGQHKTVLVKATNFKPVSPISFSYNDDSTTFQRNMNQGLDHWRGLPNFIVSDPMTDLIGSAQSKINSPTLDEANCYHYYAKYEISDGENKVNGVLGCTIEDWKAATGAYPTR